MKRYFIPASGPIEHKDGDFIFYEDYINKICQLQEELEYVEETCTILREKINNPYRRIK